MSEFPLDPQLAKMLVAAPEFRWWTPERGRGPAPSCSIDARPKYLGADYALHRADCDVCAAAATSYFLPCCCCDVMCPLAPCIFPSGLKSQRVFMLLCSFPSLL